MIAPLRKRHWIIWRIFTPLLFVGVITAYVMAPKFPMDSFNESNVNFPDLVRSVVSENYMFNLKENYSGGTILEVIQISDINPVSELVSIKYQKPGSKSATEKELGMMAGNTKYVFSLGAIEPPFSIAIMDTLKNQTLAEIDF